MRRGHNRVFVSLALVLLIGSNLSSALEPSSGSIDNRHILGTPSGVLSAQVPSQFAAMDTISARPKQAEFTSATSNSFFYVGAFINSNSDPSAVPNSGVQSTIEVVSQQVTGCLSFWVDDDAASNIWGQVGYYICSGSTPIAFYQVWNLTSNQVLTTGTASVSNGYHKFSMHSQNATNTWLYSLDGKAFGNYDMRASVSSSTYGISATTEEGYVSSPYQPTQQVEFSPALQVMQSGVWYTVQMGYEPYGCGSSGRSCWGIQGNLQDPTLPTDTIIVGGNRPVVNMGTWLWNSGQPDFTLTANPTSVGTNPNVSANSTITISPLNGFSTTVTLAVTTNSTNLSCVLSPTGIPGGSGTSTLSCTSSILGSYLANVTGTSGTLSRAVSIVYHVTNLPGFTLASNPTNVTTPPTVIANSTIAETPQNGFTGTVELTMTTNSTSLTCTLSQATLTSGRGTSTLSCRATSAGNFKATILGTSNGATSQTTTVTFHAQDFTLSSNPTGVATNAARSGASNVTITPFNGYSGTITLSISISPETGLSCTLSTQTATLPASPASTLSCVGTGGLYTVMVMGTDGAVTHSTTITYDVQDFAIAANPIGASGNAGSVLTSTITISSMGAFTGPVTLTDNVSPNLGLKCELNPTVILGGSGVSRLSCTTSTNGTFTIIVNGTSGLLTRFVTLNFKSSPSITTIIQSSLYALIIGASLMLVFLFAIRKTTRRKNEAG